MWRCVVVFGVWYLGQGRAGFRLRSSVKYPAMGADHPLPPECHDDQTTIGGCQAQQTSMERLNRLREANSQWEGIPVGNGPRKKWIFKSIGTNWQWHKFIFIGGSSMPWWNWEVIQRNGWKVIKRLVENRQTRVFATFEQGQPAKFTEQTSDKSCMTIIFF